MLDIGFQLPVGVSSRTEVTVLYAGGFERSRKRGLAESAAARQWEFSNIQELPNTVPFQDLHQLLRGPALITDAYYLQ